MTEDEMVGSYCGLDGHEFEEAPGVGDRQGGLACCSPWGHKESDTTERRKSTWTYLLSPVPLQFPTVTESFLTLCDPMNCSRPGFPVLHYLLESAQIHGH